jgi:hypothetical protein
MTVDVWASLALTVAYLLGRSTYRPLASGVFDGHSRFAWKCACAAVTLPLVVVVMALLAILFRIFPDQIESQKIITYGLIVGIISAAAYERLREPWRPYWQAIHDSLDYATKEHQKARLRFNEEHLNLLADDREVRLTARERVFDPNRYP